MEERNQNTSEAEDEQRFINLRLTHQRNDGV